MATLAPDEQRVVLDACSLAVRVWHRQATSLERYASRGWAEPTAAKVEAAELFERSRRLYALIECDLGMSLNGLLTETTAQERTQQCHS